jgi:hypothetical protein
MAKAMHPGMIFILVALLALCPSGVATAEVIVSQSSPDTTVGTWALNYHNQDLAVSFTLTSSFTDVSISASLSNTQPSGSYAGTAYLTSQIGPGTTVADQYASDVFLVPPTGTVGGTQVNPTVVISNLNLGPGTYYLVLAANGTSSTGGLGWQDATDATTTTAPGASADSVGLSDAGNTQNFSYTPASTFSALIAPDDSLLYSVTVPEPSACGLLLIGCGLVAFSFYRRHVNVGT